MVLAPAPDTVCTYAANSNAMKISLLCSAIRFNGMKKKKKSFGERRERINFLKSCGTRASRGKGDSFGISKSKVRKANPEWYRNRVRASMKSY